jgi:hypothetical protein
LHGVEITGGGEPTLHGEINEFIENIAARGLQLGLITNGVALTKNASQGSLALLRWIRISLNCLDYLDDIDIDLPSGPTLGFSYVLNARTTPTILNKVAQYAEKYGASYVRIVPDCLAPPDQIAQVRTDLKLDYPRFYIQTKTMRSLAPVAPCRMGYLKPYLSTDGFFYWCSGVCLEERRFPAEYRMGAWHQIGQIWGGSQKPFSCSFPKCFWVEQNEILQCFNTPVEHGAFI